MTEDRVARLKALLRESVREHAHCDDSWYCCGKCRAADHGLIDGEWLEGHDGEGARLAGVCTCGADAWNQRVAEALKEEDVSKSDKAITVPKAKTAHATLTLTITYDQARLPDVLEAAREVIEKGYEQGSVEGYLDIHRTGRIDIEDLR